MRLVHVIPISRSPGKIQLSYFSTLDIPKGSIVHISIRKKKVPAIVLSTEDVSDAKAKLKAENFAIKKIDTKTANRILHPSYIKAVEKASNYFASPIGQVIYRTTPSPIFNDIKNIESPDYIDTNTNSTINERLILQADSLERLEQYKNLVREEFAKKQSVFILTSTIQDTLRAYETLRRGIERYTIPLHSSLSKKEMRSNWNEVVKQKHPVLIIGTGTFLSVPRQDIKTIIVDREQSQHYKSRTRPYIDMRVFAEFLSEELQAKFIVADIPLRIESVYRFETREFDEMIPITTRSSSAGETKIIDMRDKDSPANRARKTNIKKTFATLGDELKDMIESTYKDGGNIFLYGARRGLSPMTVCLDCGSPIVCEIRNTPLILYKAQNENVFVCHEHGTVRSAKERCRVCNSWKLQSYGVGIELIADEVQKTLPEIPAYLVEAKTTSTHKQIKQTVDKFYKDDHSILIGTEMALPYLTHNIKNSAVVSIDSLLSVPEWNAYERVFSILMRIRGITERDMIVQTRKPEVPILSYLRDRNLMDFYRNEMRERKRFKYPPFSVFIKFSVEGSRAKVAEEMKKVASIFSGYEFIEQEKVIRIKLNLYRAQGFLRIPRDKWPDKEIISTIQTLPLNITVVVDPDSIL